MCVVSTNSPEKENKNKNKNWRRVFFCRTSPTLSLSLSLSLYPNLFISAHFALSNHCQHQHNIEEEIQEKSTQIHKYKVQILSIFVVIVWLQLGNLGA